MENSSKETERQASVGDVAKRAGVSVGTVSNVMNGSSVVKPETREKVLAAARELNYIPNRAGRMLKTDQTKLIMLAIPDTSNEIYFGMIEGVLTTIKEKGYSMLLYYTNALEEEELKTIGLLQERLIDGLILVHFSYSQRLMDELERTNRPVVLLGMCNHMWAKQGKRFDTISIDVFSGIYEAVSHLIRVGHRKIGYLAGRAGIEVYKQRYEAYRKALKDAGIPYREEYVWWRDFTRAGGYTCGRDLYQLPDRPTAICGSNDLQSIGCWEAIRDLGGRTPDDIALTGMDNLDITKILGITSMRMREADMGISAARLLLGHLMDNIETYQDLYYRPELQIRDSSLPVVRPN